jgi:hypothetical protein
VTEAETRGSGRRQLGYTAILTRRRGWRCRASCRCSYRRARSSRPTWAPPSSSSSPSGSSPVTLAAAVSFPPVPLRKFPVQSCRICLDYYGMFYSAVVCWVQFMSTLVDSKSPPFVFPALVLWHCRKMSQTIQDGPSAHVLVGIHRVDPHPHRGPLRLQARFLQEVEP